MTDYVWPADLVPFRQGFRLQPHTGGSESPFSRVTKTYGLSAPRWTCKIDLRGGHKALESPKATLELGRRLDALIAKLKGRQNRVYLWDFRREGEVNPAWSNQAINPGDSIVYVNGAIVGDLLEGMYIAGDGRPHQITDIRAGGPSPAGLRLEVEPAFEAYVAAGAATFFRCAGVFKLISDDAGDVMSEAGQLTPYSLEFIEDINALAGVSLYDTFTDSNGADPGRRDVQYRSIYGFGPAPAKLRAIAGGWLTDGNGYAYPSAVEGDAQNLLNACMGGPAGTAGDRTITLVCVPAGFRPGILASFDGRYAVMAEIYGVGGNNFRIRQVDLLAGAPGYGSGGNAWVELGTSPNFPSYTPASDNTLVAVLTGTSLTVTHVDSGTSLTVTVTVPIGAECGFKSNNAGAKIRSLKVEPIGTPTYFDIGNGVKMIDARVLEYLGDADGIDLADFDGDGLPGIVVGNSSNNNKTVGGVYIVDQSVRDSFTMTPVDVNSSVATTDRYNGVEGVCAVPIDNYRYVFINDTPVQGQFLLDRQTRNRIQMSAYANGQDCRVKTINGFTCILSTHEGGSGSLGMAHGGIVGRKYLGGDPMLLANWLEFPIVQRAGAWALQKTNFDFVNLNGDGQLWLVYGVRDGGANPDVTAPGLYAVPVPADPFGGLWVGDIAKYVAVDGTDFINWDFGDFSGDGNGFDVIYAVLNRQAAPAYLRKSTGFTSTAMVTLGLSATNHLYNVMKMTTRGTGTRDGFLAWVSFQGFYHGYWTGSAWAAKAIRGERVDHAWNACHGPVWDRGDGTKSVAIGNSFGGAVLDLRFK